VEVCVCVEDGEISGGVGGGVCVEVDASGDVCVWRWRHLVVCVEVRVCVCGGVCAWRWMYAATCGKISRQER